MVLLPENWEEKYSTTHKKTYYYNIKTNKRQWQIPDEKIELQKLEIQKFYDEIGTKKVVQKNYKLFLQVLRHLIIHVFLNNAKNILDVGCGPGSDFIKFYNEIITYTGLDINKSFLNIIKERYPNKSNIQLIEGDITDDNLWQKINNKFDTVICFDSLQYASCDKESLRTCIRGMKKVLQENGRLYLIVADEDYPNKNMIEYSKGTLGFSYEYQVNEEKRKPQWVLPINILEKELNTLDLVVELNANLSSIASYLGVQTPSESDLQKKTIFDILKIIQTYKKVKVDGECWHFASSYRLIICKNRLDKESYCPYIYDFTRSQWGLNIKLI